MRLLALSAGAGAGHNRAAEAIDAAARAHFPDVRSEWTDCLKYTSKLFRALYADSYVWMANHSPNLWGWLYEAMGKRLPAPGLDRAIKAFDKLAYGKIKRHIDEARPDAIVCTHFLPMNVALAMKDAPPVYVVVTDFDVHAAWINRQAAAYFVPSDEVRHLAEGFGIPPERIHITGIPIMPQFERRRGRAAVLADLKLTPRAPVALMISGGAGLANLEEAVERISRIPEDMHLLVVCGRNERMRKRLEASTRGAGDRVRIYGFVTNVHDLMEAADFVIGKSGGLTVSEALSRGVPMVVYSPTPGQEDRNCDYLLEQGAAVKAQGVETVDFKVRELLASPDRLKRMRAAAERLGRPSAARDVIQRVIGEL